MALKYFSSLFKTFQINIEVALLSNQIPFLSSFLNPVFTQDTFKTCQASQLYLLNSTWLSRQSSKGECNPVLQLLTSQVLCRPKQDRSLSPDFSGPASAGLCHSQYTSVCRWGIQLPWLCLQWIFWLSLCCNAYGTQARPSVMSILYISCTVKQVQIQFCFVSGYSLALVITVGIQF